MNEGYTKRIVGISDHRRVPRLDKVRLGVTLVKNPGKSNEVKYPGELPYFLLPRDLARDFGGQFTFIDLDKDVDWGHKEIAQAAINQAEDAGCKNKAIIDVMLKRIDEMTDELPIMFPVNTPEDFFPQEYKMYGSSRGLKCRGNGEQGFKMEEKGIIVEVGCPCDNLRKEVEIGDGKTKMVGECTPHATLNFLVPCFADGKARPRGLSGVYQIDTGAWNSIVDLNSSIDHIMRMTGGQVAMLPLTLRRRPAITYGAGSKQTHFTLQLIVEFDVERIEHILKNQGRVLTHSQAALPAPTDRKTRPDVEDFTDEEDDVIIEVKAEEIPSGEEKEGPAPATEEKETVATPEPAATKATTETPGPAKAAEVSKEKAKEPEKKEEEKPFSDRQPPKLKYASMKDMLAACEKPGSLRTLEQAWSIINEARTDFTTEEYAKLVKQKDAIKNSTETMRLPQTEEEEPF